MVISVARTQEKDFLTSVLFVSEKKSKILFEKVSNRDGFSQPLFPKKAPENLFPHSFNRNLSLSAQDRMTALDRIYVTHVRIYLPV